MSLEECNRIRRATESSRRPPEHPQTAHATFENGLDPTGPAPTELTLEATNSNGELAEWLTDDWWTDAIRQWGDDPLQIRVSASTGALLHPVFLHQLEMIRRVVPAWRLVGLTHPGEINDENAVERLAVSPYQEVRIFNSPQGEPDMPNRESSFASVAELLGRLRAAQARLGVSSPIFVRVPSPLKEPSSVDVIQKSRPTDEVIPSGARHAPTSVERAFLSDNELNPDHYTPTD